jgi:hypothetical protein
LLTTTPFRSLHHLASPTTLKTLNSLHHKGVRLALGSFAVCRTEYVLHEAGISTFAEIREQDTARIARRVITNEIHPIRSYFMNSKIHDEYATKPTFITAIEYLGQLQMDVRRIETTHYCFRPPHREGKSDTNNPYEQPQRNQVVSDFEQKQQKYNENIKIFTGGSRKNEKLNAR